MNNHLKRIYPIGAFCLVILLGVFVSSARANTLDMNWTVTVQHEGQMVPGMRLWIQVFDTYANTYSEFSGTTSSAGAYSVSRSFECSTVDNAIHFAIVARLIRSDGYVGQGSSHSGARSCTSGPGGTTLGLAVAFPGTYDRDNAAGCGSRQTCQPKQWKYVRPTSRFRTSCQCW